MSNQYDVKLSRRESLKWIAAMSVTAAVPGVSFASLVSIQEAYSGHWPDLKLKPIKANGYGKDPNLLVPPESPWPKTLTQGQLNLVSTLSDIIVPAEDKVPSGSQVGVPDVIDEWISAPYHHQQQDRILILNGLAWLDDESQSRFNIKFVDATVVQQISIVEDIAYQGDDVKPEFVRMAKAFDRIRALALAAFFCTPEGTRDLGYQGNVPIMGDYPGPTPEAMAHLNAALADLNLTL